MLEYQNFVFCGGSVGNFGTVRNKKTGFDVFLIYGKALDLSKILGVVKKFLKNRDLSYFKITNYLQKY